MTKFTASEELISAVKDMVDGGSSHSEIRRYIQDVTGFRKTKRNELFQEIMIAIDADKREAEYACPETRPLETQPVEPKPETKLEFGERYTYNKDSDQYVVFLKSAGRNVVVPGSTHRAMLKAYSNWTGDPRSINDLCNAFEMPKEYFEEYKAIMGWTHSHEPVTKEQLETEPTDKLVEDILSQKRFALNQKFQKKDWQETQRDAILWREFLSKNIDPFTAALQNWAPPECKPLPACRHMACDEDIFVAGFFDWHIGGLAEKRYMFRGKEWNLAEAERTVENFGLQVQNTILQRITGFKKGVILIGGDILHGLRGKTEKGVPLLYDRVRDEQFDAALCLLKKMIDQMAELFPTLEVHVVRGNHDGADAYPLAIALSAFYYKEDRIKFNIYSSKTAMFRVGSVLVLLDHGASDFYKAKVPTNEKAKQSYVQSMLLAHPEQLIGVKQKIFVCGDQHSFKQTEFNDFEYFMFGALALGDQYAEALNLESRPRQNCLVIGPNGVSEVLHYYLD